MNQMTIRLATLDDLTAIVTFIADAKQVLAKQHSGQWQDQHPRQATIAADITAKRYYVITHDNHVVGGLAVLDYEADYEHLLEGVWLTNGPYLVIHRFAVHSAYHGRGYALAALNYVEELARLRGVRAIRVDTHEKNKPMISLLRKAGYAQVGVVLLTNFKRRIAFEKVLPA